MASAPATDAAPQPRKTAKKKSAPKVLKGTKAIAAAKRKPTAQKPRQLFIPGSLNDHISKLGVGESMGHVLRIPVQSTSPTLSSQAQKFFKAKNSVLSGGIAKVRSAPEHANKRFTMERGSYMTASNDAMFAFLTITRME